MPHAVSERLKPLRDIVSADLDILFVGTSPGPRSSNAQHYFAGRTNVFWRLLFESGLTPCMLTAQQDNEMIEYKYGLTDIIKKPTIISNIQKKDARGSIDKLNRHMTELRPKVAAFVGKRGFQIYNKTPTKKYAYGYQRTFKNTRLYMLPSSSGQSYADTKYDEKLCWYTKLREYVCSITGDQNRAPGRTSRPRRAVRERAAV